MIPFDPTWEYYTPDPEFAPDPEEAEADRAVAVAELMSLHTDTGVFLRSHRKVSLLGECEQCKRPIRSDRVTERRFCSRRCVYEFRWPKTATPRPCQTCGVTIVNRKLITTGAKYCSRDCYVATLRKPIAERPCKACGKLFTPVRLGTPGVACSRICGGKLRRTP